MRPPPLTHLRRRAGVYLNRARRSIWFHGDAVADFAAADGLVRSLRRRVSTDRFLFTARDALACAWLRERYPNDNVLPLPLPIAPLLDRFFAQLNPRLVIVLGNAEGLSLRLLERARSRGLEILSAAEASGDAAAFQAALERSFPDERLADPTAPRRMASLAQTALGRWIVALQSRRRLASWDELRRRLGNPRSILCLGNGPSCEDPHVPAVDHDCLMRVNWRWLERGMLMRPDMVFVGDLRTPRKLAGCVFGFRDLAWEAEVLLRQVVFGGSLRALEHFTLERVPSLVTERHWTALPTNGAVMVAVAAALAPERLTIAGMDLYRHPAGRYPGDRSPENDFPQMHDAEVEIEIIAAALAAFGGEVTILSEALREALSSRG